MARKTTKTNQKITAIYQQRKRRTVEHVTKAKPLVSSRTKPKTKHDDVAGTSGDEKLEHLNILRQFDLNWEYGPCTNITREERWMRAEKLGQKPPPFVMELLNAHPNDKDYTDNVWCDYEL